MKWNPEYLFSGIILLVAVFLMYVNGYQFFFPPMLLGLALVLITTGIFEKRSYYNKNYYVALITMILLVTLVLSYIQISASNIEKSIAYIFFALFLLAIIWLVYNFIHKMERYIESLESYNQALERNPHDIVALNNMGTILAEHKEYHEALTYFDKALKIDSKDVAALHNKGFVFNKLNKYKEAAKYYNKASELDSSFEIAKKSGEIILEKKSY